MCRRISLPPTRAGRLFKESPNSCADVLERQVLQYRAHTEGSSAAGVGCAGNNRHSIPIRAGMKGQASGCALRIGRGLAFLKYIAARREHSYAGLLPLHAGLRAPKDAEESSDST